MLPGWNAGATAFLAPQRRWNRLWESEAALVKTLLLALDDGTVASMNYEQQKRFVIDGVVKSHAPHPGVNYIIFEEGESPKTAKALLTFPTYKELLDKMYVDSEHAQQQLQQQQCPQTATMQLQGALRQQNADYLRLMQQIGTAPTHYHDGIPHYSGLPHW
jgi:hypothetical protein